ncbi:STAS domain-containing protein [Paenibacillus koleovorans]|uniref:STAS domain-containing protein n=1 Tax=Paenibacillus koleovorans TaxID=121608 RepID=UPI000FD75BF2|nr:STAS domain-containing protein [Paenibacillus koleovorans]
MTVQKFRIDQHHADDEIVLHISGDLDLAAAIELKAVLETVVHEADKRLILDLEGLRYIDSTGIGILVSVVKIRDEAQATFEVRHIPASVKKLFDLTGISGFLIERK